MLEADKKFELLLDSNWFNNKDILEYCGQKLEVIDTPKKHYSKWYWRILNFLTFRLFFNVKYTYTVKIIRNE